MKSVSSAGFGAACLFFLAFDALPVSVSSSYPCELDTVHYPVYKTSSSGTIYKCRVSIEGCYGGCSHHFTYKAHLKNDTDAHDFCEYSYRTCAPESHENPVSRTLTDCEQCDSNGDNCSTPSSISTLSATVKDAKSCICEQQQDLPCIDLLVPS